MRERAGQKSDSPSFYSTPDGIRFQIFNSQRGKFPFGSPSYHSVRGINPSEFPTFTSGISGQVRYSVRSGVGFAPAGAVPAGLVLSFWVDPVQGCDMVHLLKKDVRGAFALSGRVHTGLSTEDITIITEEGNNKKRRPVLDSRP